MRIAVVRSTRVLTDAPGAGELWRRTLELPGRRPAAYVLQALRAALPRSHLLGSEIYVNGLPYAANRIGPDVKLCQMDAREIPYSAEFDLICAFDVLEHIEEDEHVLEEFCRALRPGGGVLLSVPQHPFLEQCGRDQLP